MGGVTRGVSDVTGSRGTITGGTWMTTARGSGSKWFNSKEGRVGLKKGNIGQYKITLKNRGIITIAFLGQIITKKDILE